MKAFLLSLLFILSPSLAALAGVGETESQLAARYGQPLFSKPTVVKGSVWCEYGLNGVNIDVVFVDGISQEERYRREGRPFTGDEIKALLATAVVPGTWTNLQELDHLHLKKDEPLDVLLLRKDGVTRTALAGLNAPNFLAVQTPDYVNKLAALQYPTGPRP